jgi:hypothetical protein
VERVVSVDTAPKSRVEKRFAGVCETISNGRGEGCISHEEHLTDSPHLRTIRAPTSSYAETLLGGNV